MSACLRDRIKIDSRGGQSLKATDIIECNKDEIGSYLDVIEEMMESHSKQVQDIDQPNQAITHD